MYILPIKIDFRRLVRTIIEDIQTSLQTVATKDLTLLSNHTRMTINFLIFHILINMVTYYFTSTLYISTLQL